MRITDRFMDVGEFAFTLDETRMSLDRWDLINEGLDRWAYIAVFDTELDPGANQSSPLGSSRWAGRLQRRNGSEFAGMSLVGQMGNRLGRSERFSANYSSATTLATYLGGVVANLPSVSVDATGLNTLTIDLNGLMVELDAVRAGCALAGAQWRVDPNETFNAAQQVGDDLDVLVCEDGIFIDGIQLPGAIGGVQRDVESWATDVVAVDADGTVINNSSLGSTPPYTIRDIAGSALSLLGTLQLDRSAVGATQARNLADLALARHNTDRVRFTLTSQSTDDLWWRSVRPGDTILAHSRQDAITGSEAVDVGGVRVGARRLTVDEQDVQLTRRSVVMAWHDGTSVVAYDITDWLVWPEEFRLTSTFDSVPPGESRFERLGFNPITTVRTGSTFASVPVSGPGRGGFAQSPVVGQRGFTPSGPLVAKATGAGL